MEVAVGRLDRGEVLLDDLAWPTTAGRPAASSRADRSTHHGASPRIGGTLNRPSSTAGAAASTSAGRRRAGTSGRSTFSSGYGWAVGGTSSRSRASTSAGVVEHRGELAGEGLELVVGQLEPGQPGDVGDVWVVMRPVTGPS